MYFLRYYSFFCGLLLSSASFAIDSDKIHRSVSSLLDKNSIRNLMSIRVDTAAKVPEKIALSSAVINVITADDIALYGYKSVAEALSHIAGFVETDDLVTHNFGVRGINAGLHAASRIVKFLINGQNSAYRSNDQNFIGAELIPMDLIERIEVIKGPVSALYGANAFVGVVNVITRKGRRYKHLGNQASITLQQGKNGKMSQSASFSAGAYKKRWDYSFGIHIANTDRSGLSLPRSSPFYYGYQIKNQTNNTQKDNSRPLSAYGRLEYRDKAQQKSFQISTYIQQLNSDQNFSDLNPLQTTGGSRIVRTNGFIRLDAKKAWAKAWEGSIFATYSQGQPSHNDKIEVGATDYYLQQQQGFHGIDLGAELIYNPLNQRNVLLFGWDFKHDRQQLAQFSRVQRLDGSRIILNDRYDTTLINQGIYAQWQHHFKQKWLKSKWHSTLGMRYDQNSYYQNNQSIRLAMIAELDNKQVIKLLLGTAFQAPSAELLFRKAVQAGDIIGNDQLKVQKATTIELNWLYPINEKLYLNSTLFMTKIQDLVRYQILQSNMFPHNNVTSNSKGLEMELQYRYKKWQAYSNFIWQQTQFDDDPLSLNKQNNLDQNTLFPNFSANVGIAYRWKKHSLALNNRFIGKRYASAQNIIILQRRYRLNEYINSNLTWRYQGFSLIKDKKAIIEVQIKNLWDSQPVNPGFGGIDIPTQRRRILFSFQQRF